MKHTYLAFSCVGLFLGISFVVAGNVHLVSGAEKDEVAKYQKLIAKLKPLHTKLGKAEPGEWLAEHNEAGQLFAQYVRSSPNVPTGKRTIIYIQPLGDFDAKQREIVDKTGDFMGRYFGLKVKIMDDLPLSVIPKKARRKHPSWGVDQVLSTYVLDSVLKPRLPEDAIAYIAFTASDLWPGEGWNFVFGQASLNDRVGVWSINRNGDPNTNADSYRLCLIRTLKTATHETGHMFSLPHCTAYMCNMCGSNHHEEADKHPVEVCPECVAKICWGTGVDPKARFERLAEFCKQNDLKPQAEFYEKSAGVLK